MWSRFNPGRRIHIARARTVFVRPFRSTRELTRGVLSDEALQAEGWKLADWPEEENAFLPAVTRSFIGGSVKVKNGDIRHYVKELPDAQLPGRWQPRRAHLSLYPNQLALVWVDGEASGIDLFTLASEQAALAEGDALSKLAPLASVIANLAPLSSSRWQVYGSYAIDRSASTMIDDAPSVQGLLHALASGTPPTLDALPADGGKDAHQILREPSGDVEHWLSSTGGAPLPLRALRCGVALSGHAGS